MNRIKITREEETAIDKNLGEGFKRQMSDFANKITDLMMQFPIAQGHSRPAQYLQQPFNCLAEAARLCKRFGASEAERDKEDAVLKGLPGVMESLASLFSESAGEGK